MRTKHAMFVFFKYSLKMRAGTPILELDEGILSTFAKFEYERSSMKTERVIFCFFFREEDTFWAGIQFYVEM